MRISSRVISGLVSGLLVVEAIYFIWVGVAFYRLYLIAQGPAAGVAVPGMVWQNGFVGLLLLIAAVGYALDIGRLRLWVAALSPIVILYGMWGWWSGRQFVGSWRSIFELDLVACGVASGLVFVLIGMLAAAYWWTLRGGTRQTWR
jgi:hypothetical protein